MIKWKRKDTDICFICSNKIYHREVRRMKEIVKKYIKPTVFTLGGALAGLAYYRFVGCPTGSCPIAANPVISMLYMAVIGWLLSCIFSKGCDDKCNM